MGPIMKSAKHVACGFVAMATAISIFVTTVWLDAYLNLWIGLSLLLFLAFPFVIRCIGLLKRFTEKQPAKIRVKQAKNLLMALQGAGVACWFFDVLSTVFNINITQKGTELNPLGWPYSAPAALAYYIPVAFVAYYLLFRVKTKASFYAVVAISAVTLFMGARNLFASLHNFTGISSAFLIANLEVLGIWVSIAAVLAVLNITSVLNARNKMQQEKLAANKMGIN